TWQEMKRAEMMKNKQLFWNLKKNINFNLIIINKKLRGSV
ncbi:unnamed protein product, partial [Allacma fusca]